jgi:hypothetical protein
MELPTKKLKATQPAISEEELIANHNSIGNINLGFSAASFAGILSLLQLKEYDAYLTVFLVCFAVIMPMSLLIGVTSSYTDMNRMQPQKDYPIFVILATSLECFIAFIGISSLILHFSIPIGVVFIIVGILSSILFINRFKYDN